MQIIQKEQTNIPEEKLKSIAMLLVPKYVVSDLEKKLEESERARQRADINTPRPDTSYEKLKVLLTRAQNDNEELDALNSSYAETVTRLQNLLEVRHTFRTR